MSEATKDLRFAMSGAVHGIACATARLADGLRAEPDAPASMISRARDAQKAIAKEANSLAVEIAIWERAEKDCDKEPSSND